MKAGKKTRKARSYRDKITLKLNGHSRDPRWMWWTENVSGDE